MKIKTLKELKKIVKNKEIQFVIVTTQDILPENCSSDTLYLVLCSSQNDEKAFNNIKEYKTVLYTYNFVKDIPDMLSEVGKDTFYTSRALAENMGEEKPNMLDSEQSDLFSNLLDCYINFRFSYSVYEGEQTLDFASRLKDGKMNILEIKAVKWLVKQKVLKVSPTGKLVIKDQEYLEDFKVERRKGISLVKVEKVLEKPTSIFILPPDVPELPSDDSSSSDDSDEGKITEKDYKKYLRKDLLLSKFIKKESIFGAGTTVTNYKNSKGFRYQPNYSALALRAPIRRLLKVVETPNPYIIEDEFYTVRSIDVIQERLSNKDEKYKVGEKLSKKEYFSTFGIPFGEIIKDWYKENTGNEIDFGEDFQVNIVDVIAKDQEKLKTQKLEEEIERKKIETETMLKKIGLPSLDFPRTERLSSDDISRTHNLKGNNNNSNIRISEVKNNNNNLSLYNERKEESNNSDIARWNGSGLTDVPSLDKKYLISNTNRDETRFIEAAIFKNNEYLNNVRIPESMIVELNRSNFNEFTSEIQRSDTITSATLNDAELLVKIGDIFFKLKNRKKIDIPNGEYTYSFNRRYNHQIIFLHLKIVGKRLFFKKGNNLNSITKDVRAMSSYFY